MSNEDTDAGDRASASGHAGGWWADVSRSIRFLSVYPIGQAPEGSGRLTRESVRAFGVAGAILGAISCVTLFVVSWIGFDPLLCSILVIASQIRQTGALHEDGLADVADGFGGGMTRERKLEIMRDSRIGTFGVVALIITIGIRVGSLSALIAAMPVLAVAAVIVAVAVASRAAMGQMMHDLPNARSDGRSADVGHPDAATIRQLMVTSAVIVLPLLVWASGFMATLIAVATALLAHMVMKLKAERHIGGQTGDVLGANQQVCEVVLLLVLAGLAS